jgi:hypothetical protein
MLLALGGGRLVDNRPYVDRLSWCRLVLMMAPQTALRSPLRSSGRLPQPYQPA